MMPAKVAIVGCGAITQLSHAPVLQTLAAGGRVTIAAAVDPDAGRRTQTAALFHGCRAVESIDALSEADVDLAIVASPVRFHAAQTTALLGRGIHVLCEKPLAGSVAEAESMVAAAHSARRVLAAGMFRRFFPALQSIGQMISQRTFGPLHGFAIEEGGPFNWPAATPSFFDPKQAGGGVLLDAGIHVLDVLGWWLGEPVSARYADDAEGGLEATSRLTLGFATATAEPLTGTVLLSRDWRTANTWTLEFEKATVLWRVGEADRLELRPRGAAHWLVSRLENENASGRVPADRYPQAFTRQMVDVLDAVQHGRALRVPGDEALRSLRLIERCYRERTPLLLSRP